MTTKQLEEKAKEARKLLLQAAFSGRSGHIGSAFSPVDVITALYFDILRIDPKRPGWDKRDIFILSKGHGCLGLYAVLALRGYFPCSALRNYFKDGSILAGHPVLGSAPGIEASTGSLGHGLPIGIGLALGFKKQKSQRRVVIMLSDGECDEGSTWEAVLAAPNLRLDNLTVVVDYNKIQSFGRVEDVMPLEPFADKWKAFGWNVVEIDGHDMGEILKAFSKAGQVKKKPTVVIAHTVKGKGVRFMEDKMEWHYFNLDEQKLKDALADI